MSDKSIRQQALEKIRDNIRAIVKDQPISDPSPMAFSRVELGPLGVPDKLKRFVCGIATGPETKKSLFPFVECTLRVTVEFYASVQANEGSQELCETIMTRLQLVMSADGNLGGLVVDVKEVRNEMDLETYGDKTAAGALFYEVKYRHNENDPRILQ